MTDAVSKGSPLTAPTATASVASGPFSAAYTRYALWLLLGLSVVNFIDRSIVNILAEPIKKELGLHDWQLGVMTGLGFAVVYTLCGLPIARLAERRNRSLIITASAVVWGGFTFLCGSAQSFAQLLLYRTGVGLGEAGYGPTAVSLISDYVSPAKRASSLAFYAMGAPIGGLMGLALGGIVADAYGWRGAFLLVGLPALILAALAFFTLREPRKLLASQAAKNQETKATFGETLRSLGGKRAYWLVMLGAATKTFINLGHAPFVVSFFLRNHGHEISGLASHIGLLSIGFLGLATGLLNGVPGVIGTYFGGWMADKLGAKDRRNIVLTPSVASFLCIPIFAGVMFADRVEVAFLFLGLNWMVSSTWFGPSYSTAQSVVPPHMRATSAAILGLVTTLAGIGLGPLVVGALSDYYNHGLGLGPNAGLRWAMMTTALLGAVAGTAYWQARKSLDRDMVS